MNNGLGYWGRHSGLQCPLNTQLMLLVNGEEICVGDKALAVIVILAALILVRAITKTIFVKSEINDTDPDRASASCSDDEYELVGNASEGREEREVQREDKNGTVDDFNNAPAKQD